MPVFRPTADCIWNTFRSSGKTRILLSGGEEGEREQLLSQLQALGYGLPETSGASDALAVDLDHPYGNPGCVILASGLGTRFGGNKLMAPFRGQPMICRAIAATEGIFSRRVVVTRHPEVMELCRELNIPALLHALPYRSDTVRLGLEALGDVDGCLFCPGDQPLLKRLTVASLALWAKNEPDSILRPAFDGIPGAPVFFPKWAFPELKTLPAGKGGGVLAKKYPASVKLLHLTDGKQLQDADTPETLAWLARQ